MVVQEVNQPPQQLVVRSIDSMQGALNEGISFCGQVGHIYIGVLQPCVCYQPRIHH